MMTNWADQEEQVSDHYPKRGDDYNKNKWGDNKPQQQSQRDYSDSNSKRTPDDVIAAIERSMHGKKCTTQEQFDNLP